MHGFIKLNFNGVARGNLGPTRDQGGALRNDKGDILFVFTCYLGRWTNNVFELDGLIKGFFIAKSLNLKILVVEGESVIIILALTKILCSSFPDKVSSN
jgi:ribonuclease HI